MESLIGRHLVSRWRTWVSAGDGRAVGLAGALTVLAIVIGALLALLTPVGGVAVLVAGVAGVLALRDVRWSLFALIAVACLLPFASLPFSIGFTPTFLDIAFGALYVVWAVRLITRRQGDFQLSPVGVPVVVFVALAVFSFVLGLAHSRPTSNDLRTFAEILMGFGMFFVAVNCVREESLLRQVTAVLVLCGAAEAGIGVALYVLPASWAVRLLNPLGMLGYPVGYGALRYINDDPGRPMRAIGTNVDPNILGALLVVVLAITATQLVARRPVLPRWLLACAAAVMGLGLFLTYSRGSMGGAVVAVGLVALLRYRRLLVVLLIAGLLLLLLPQTQAYISHFVEGIRIQDRSTLMRMGEYRDTFRLIQRYPWLGVGFVGTPDIDLYVAVASLYLAIAAQMGVIGVLAFLAVVIAFAAVMWRALQATPRGSSVESYLLGYGAAVAGSLAAGVLDHTLLTYPHAVALLWLVLGLGAAAARLSQPDRTPVVQG